MSSSLYFSTLSVLLCASCGSIQDHEDFALTSADHMIAPDESEHPPWPELKPPSVQDELTPVYIVPEFSGDLDYTDLCPDDPVKNFPGVCGCGTADADADYDGVFNCKDSPDVGNAEQADADQDEVEAGSKLG